MNLEEFVKNNTGKKVDYDGVFGPQCVDLARQYWKDVLDVPEKTEPCLSSGGAKDLFIDYLGMPKEKKYFERITEDFFEGDTLIWNATSTNEYGHIAIYLGELGDSFIVFEQDGFKKDGAKINIRSKSNLLGALRRR